MQILAGTTRGLVDVDVGAVIALADSDVGAIADGPDGVWAIVDAEVVSLAASVADGVWENVARVVGARSLCVVGAGDVWVGTDAAHVVHVSNGLPEPNPGFDAAPGRDDWYTPAPPLHVRSFAYSDGVGLFAGVHVGGILRSADGGESWSPTIDIDVDVHEVRADADGVLFSANGAAGLAVSNDAGETWQTRVAGLHATYLRAVAIAGDRALVTASAGPGGELRSAIYAIPLVGSVFTKVHEGLPDFFDTNIDTGCLDASGDLAAFGTEAGEVFVSADAGETWELAYRGRAPVRCVRISDPGA